MLVEGAAGVEVLRCDGEHVPLIGTHGINLKRLPCTWRRRLCKTPIFQRVAQHLFFLRGHFNLAPCFAQFACAAHLRIIFVHATFVGTAPGDSATSADLLQATSDIR